MLLVFIQTGIKSAPIERVISLVTFSMYNDHGTKSLFQSRVLRAVYVPCKSDLNIKNPSVITCSVCAGEPSNRKLPAFIHFALFLLFFSSLLLVSTREKYTHTQHHVAKKNNTSLFTACFFNNLFILWWIRSYSLNIQHSSKRKGLLLYLGGQTRQKNRFLFCCK